MREHVERQFGFLRSTAIGGIVFLLPLIVVGYLLGQVGSIVYWIAQFLNETFEIRTVHGYTVLLMAAIAVLIILCFGAGVAAQLAIGKKFSGIVEKHLIMIFPRYSIYKDQVAGGIGGELGRDRMKPVLIDHMGIYRPGLEIERSDDGRVTVYFPGSPDPWSGTFGFLKSEQVTNIDVDLGEFLATFERLGRDSYPLLRDAWKASQAGQVESTESTA
ncbi:hypothetical protein V7x_34020 [Crateriforma conspicua]|uniref:DUF502 domain-containing protein n=1 Tax=Crateriforma conspicua TaxID=2527996 RepID=A0A5C6FK90_9PLAN|nr:DUF502 domain-containing protein [Crateriforma conspicua]TWU61714.1 hypothetical protein V7x_34020 [Crateriforma conspicua]